MFCLDSGHPPTTEICRIFTCNRKKSEFQWAMRYRDIPLCMYVCRYVCVLYRFIYIVYKCAKTYQYRINILLTYQCNGIIHYLPSTSQMLSSINHIDQSLISYCSPFVACWSLCNLLTHDYQAHYVIFDYELLATTR